MLVPWLELALFMASVGLLALYGLALSGHFPADCRDGALRTARGAAVLWATLAMTLVAAGLAGDAAMRVLRWPLIIIGSGAMLLAAPLLLRLFSDRFVNGISALMAFASAALAISVVLMRLASS